MLYILEDFDLIIFEISLCITANPALDDNNKNGKLNLSQESLSFLQVL
jgi:hypothetical protein